MTAPAADERSLGRWWLPALAGLVPLFLLAWHFAWVCDDAFISFRFARNLARGDGLVFNPGLERVEGFSNLGWVLLAAAVEAVGAAPAAVLPVISALCMALLVARVVRFLALEAELGAPGLLAAALVLGTFPPLAVWSTSGLASAPVALATWWLFESLARRQPRGPSAAAAALVLVLLRADGPVWAGIAGGAVLLARGLRDDRPVRAALVAAGAAALGLAGLLAWRLAYYGDWLPQTARAKGRLDAETLRRGWNYAVTYFLAFPSVPLLLLLAVVRAPLWRGRLAAAAVLAIGANLTYAVASGGDFMAMGRFFVPTAPLLGVVAGRVVGESWRRAALLVPVAAALSLPAAFDHHAVPESVRSRFHFRWNSAQFESELAMWRGMKRRAEKHAVLGRALRALTEPDASVVMGAIGAVGYYSDRVIWDQNGLVCRDVTRRSPRLFRRSPGHDFFVARDFFRGRASLAAANVLDFESGDFLVPVRWDGCRFDPMSSPGRFEQRMLVRGDADPGRVAAAARRYGWRVAPARPESALPAASGLLLVSWRE